MTRRPRIAPAAGRLPARGRRRSLERPPLEPLDAHLGYWLRYVSNQVMYALSRKIGKFGLTGAEWVVLRELYEGDQRPATLAEKLGLSRGAISKLADRLEAKHMLTQRALTAGRRAQILALTGVGRATVPTLAAIADENDAEFFGGLDPRAREVIVTALREVIRRRGSRAAPPGWI